MTVEVESYHPGSAALSWWTETAKNQEGYAPLSGLIEFLEEHTKTRGVIFLKRMSSTEWKREYGWFLEFHGWRPNRVRIVLPGSPSDFSCENSGVKVEEVAS